jgi:Ca2+/Na+ antiporter
LGISIIAEMFMAGIEKITSQTKTVNIMSKDGKTVIGSRTFLVWNAAVANLSLMALGSSAPEILLAVIETVSTLGECPGELGPSTIVGSAAFNLLVISGLSVLAVTEENDNDPRRDKDVPVGVKKINDMGVFSITSTTSIAAYLWLWYVLMDQNV